MSQFKKLLLVFSMLFLASNAYGQNQVYIDQIGNGSQIDVTQTGDGNTLGTATVKTVLYGDTQQITISQIGAGNTSNINIQGVGAHLTSNVTGDSNTVDVSCGASGGAGAACTDSIISASVTGSGNHFNVTGGAKSTFGVSAVGSSNTVTINSSTTNLNGATASIQTLGGDGNSITLSQSGPAAINGFNTTVNLTGSSNTIGITQSGTVDSTVNLVSTGTNNLINIRSGN
jgi:hypothetical protein